MSKTKKPSVFDRGPRQVEEGLPDYDGYVSAYPEPSAPPYESYPASSPELKGKNSAEFDDHEDYKKRRNQYSDEKVVGRSIDPVSAHARDIQDIADDRREYVGNWMKSAFYFALFGVAVTFGILAIAGAAMTPAAIIPIALAPIVFPAIVGAIAGAVHSIQNPEPAKPNHRETREFSERQRERDKGRGRGQSRENDDYARSGSDYPVYTSYSSLPQNSADAHIKEAQRHRDIAEHKIAAREQEIGRDIQDVQDLRTRLDQASSSGRPLQAERGRLQD